MLAIREATETDFDRIWPIFQAIASPGDTYAYPTDVTKAEGRRLWIDTPRKTFAVEDVGPSTARSRRSHGLSQPEYMLGISVITTYFCDKRSRRRDGY